MKCLCYVLTSTLILILSPAIYAYDEPPVFKDSPQEFGLIFRRPGNPGDQARVQARSGGKVFVAASQNYVVDRERAYRTKAAYPADDAATIEGMVKKKQAFLLGDGTKIQFVHTYLDTADQIITSFSEVRILNGPAKDKVAFIGRSEYFLFDTFPLKVGDEAMLSKGRLMSHATGVVVVGEVPAYNALLKSWRDGEPDQNNSKAREAESVRFQEPGTRVRVKEVACSPDRVAHFGLAGSAVSVEALEGPDQGKVGWAIPETVVFTTAASKPEQTKATPRAGWRAMKSEANKYTVELAGPPNILESETIDGAEAEFVGYRTRGLEMLVVAARRPSETPKAEEFKVLRRIRERAVSKLGAKLRTRYEREEEWGPLKGMEFEVNLETPPVGQFYGSGLGFVDGKMAYILVVVAPSKVATIPQEAMRFLGSFATTDLSARAKAAAERRPAKPATTESPSSWGTEVDPDGDVKIIVSGQSLTMQIPGTPHVLAPERDKMNAPRVTAPVLGDLTVVVRVDGAFHPDLKSTVKGLSSRQTGGLILWKNPGNYLVFQHRASVDEGKVVHQAVLEELRGSDKGVTHRQAIPEGATFLRLERKGSRLTAAFSKDGKDWNEMKPVVTTWADGVVQVGVVAVNTSTGPHKVTFNEFSLKEK
jgi:regulation of enolase protein 1 (concanavalin A-like superfamily)